jgi:hypothetical protein
VVVEKLGLREPMKLIGPVALDPDVDCEYTPCVVEAQQGQQDVENRERSDTNFECDLLPCNRDMLPYHGPIRCTQSSDVRWVASVHVGLIFDQL